MKRRAASFALAARSNGFASAYQRDATLACARSYRKWIAKYADMRALDVWYARIDMNAVLAADSDVESAARLRRRQGRGGPLFDRPKPARSFDLATFMKAVVPTGRNRTQRGGFRS